MWRNTKKCKDGDETADSSDESDKEEASKHSTASSLPPPVTLKERRPSIFSKISRRRLTQISFTSVTRKFQKERIKRKWVSFDGFENKLTPSHHFHHPSQHQVRFSFINTQCDAIVRLPSDETWVSTDVSVVVCLFVVCCRSSSHN